VMFCARPMEILALSLVSVNASLMMEDQLTSAAVIAIKVQTFVFVPVNLLLTRVPSGLNGDIGPSVPLAVEQASDNANVHACMEAFVTEKKYKHKTVFTDLVQLVLNGPHGKLTHRVL